MKSSSTRRRTILVSLLVLAAGGGRLAAEISPAEIRISARKFLRLLRLSMKAETTATRDFTAGSSH